MTLEIVKYGRITWTNIIRATPDDVELLRQEYPHFHPLDLEDVLSRIERPKVDQYEDYLFSVMHFPVWDRLSSISRPSEVDIFVGATYMVTIHDGTLKPLVTLFEQCHHDESARQRYMSQGASRLYYTAVDQLVDYIFPILNKVDRNIRIVEENIFSRNNSYIIKDIAVIRRDNIALRRIVRPQTEILAYLEKTESPFIRDELDVYFGDIRDHLNKATDLISDHKEIIEGLADTVNTLATHRTNEVVQILTVISVIMMPLTLISGIYGMNVELPLQNSPVAFVFVSVMMLLISMSMLAYFKLRGWL